MTNEEDLEQFKQALEEQRIFVSRSPRIARQILYEEGVIDKDGNLTDQYKS